MLLKFLRKINNLSSDFGLLNAIQLIIFKNISTKIYNLKIIRILYKENIDIIEKYSKNNIKINENTKFKTKKIWVFWWQGLDKMPDIVKCCVISMYKSNNDREIVFLTQYNFQQYANIPENIIQKLNDRKITVTHFSDILRFSLLKEWGGVWIDATILLTDQLDDKIFQMPFYSRRIGKSSKYVPNGKWSAYFLAGDKNNIVFSIVCDILYKYWNIHGTMIDYFLVDYAIRLCYENVKDVTKMIDNVPLNNERVHELSNRLNIKFDANYFCSLCEDTTLHKLSWKGEYQKINRKGEKTFYSFIIGKYFPSNDLLKRQIVKPFTTAHSEIIPNKT